MWKLNGGMLMRSQRGENNQRHEHLKVLVFSPLSYQSEPEGISIHYPQVSFIRFFKIPWALKQEHLRGSFF